MNGKILPGLAAGLALLAIGAAWRGYADVEVTKSRVHEHDKKPMHSGARMAVDAIREELARIDREAQVRDARKEAKLDAIAEKLGVR